MIIVELLYDIYRYGKHVIIENENICSCELLFW